MNNREAILDKIKKLIKLSDNNTNENEAIAAALKAQKLIAEYDVQEHELSEDIQDEIITLTSESFSGKSWRIMLAHVVAVNFRCKAFRTDFYELKEHDYGSSLKHKINFVGYSYDAKAACLVYTKLINVGERKVKELKHQAYLKYGTSQGVQNTYLLGFCRGVKSELEKQSQALMLIVPQAVEDEFNKLETKTTSFDYDRNHLNAEDIGYSDGKDAIRSSRLESGERNLIEG